MVTTITTREARTHFSRYPTEVEKGQEFLISRGKRPVARLLPLEQQPMGRVRPKVGETLGERFHVPEDALAPLSEEELKGDRRLSIYCLTPVRSFGLRRSRAGFRQLPVAN